MSVDEYADRGAERIEILSTEGLPATAYWPYTLPQSVRDQREHDWEELRSRIFKRDDDEPICDYDAYFEGMWPCALNSGHDDGHACWLGDNIAIVWADTNGLSAELESLFATAHTVAADWSMHLDRGRYGQVLEVVLVGRCPAGADLEAIAQQLFPGIDCTTIPPETDGMWEEAMGGESRFDNALSLTLALQAPRRPASNESTENPL
jgi:hypothetical protein